MLDAAIKHPFSIVSLICLLLFFMAGIFFNTSPIDAFDVQYLFVVAFISLCGADNMRKLTLLLISICLWLLYTIISATPLFLFIAEIAVLCFLIISTKHTENVITFGIIALTFLIHLFYIQISAVDDRQHDLNGIVLYMQLIIKDGFNWREFDPWYMYYLFHQPLHFITASYIYVAEKLLWNSSSIALEGLQYLSLFYVTGTSIFAVAIFKILNIRSYAYYTSLLLLAFNPTLILFSGYISDDVPVLFWSVATSYFVIRWYKEEKLCDIILAGISFGLGTISKLSILMLVPALGAIFGYKLFAKCKNKYNIYIGLSLFVIIAVPLSLAWILRNHILFDMQFWNVPDTSPYGQNFLYLSLWDRLSDFSKLTYPFINSPYSVDANMLLALVKTELFGEWDFSLYIPTIITPAIILYWMNIILKIAAFYGVITILFRAIKDYNNANIFQGFMVIMYLTIWIYSLKYAMDYPYACSTDYRLFAQLILPECVILSQIAKNKTAQKVFFAVSLFYSILSATIYLVII